MNPKLALAVMALVAVGAYFLWPNSEMTEESAEQVMSAPDQAEAPPPMPESFAFPAHDAGAVAGLEPEQQEKIDELQTEIKSLMADFETHRKDADRRNEIQAEIDGLLAEYNEIILPIALSQMKEEQ